MNRTRKSRTWFIGIIWALTVFVPGPVRASDFLKRAETTYKASRRKQEKSLLLFQKAAQDPKTAFKAYVRLGEIYLNRGETEKAISQLQKAIQLVPEDFEARKYLALAYIKSDRLIKARFIFGLLRETRPDDPEVLYYLGLIAEKKHLFDEALDNYRKLTAHYPRHSLSAKARESIGRLEKGSAELTLKTLDDSEVEQLIKQARQGQAEYPEAGALILLREHRYTVKPDNTMTKEIHCLIKILKDRGKRFGEVELDYDSGYQSVQVKLARTFKGSGQIVEAGLKSMRDLTPWSGFPLYSNVKVRVISMPEVTPGSIIEYKATIHSNHLLNDDNFSFSHLLQAGEPIIRQRIVLNLPRDRSVKYRTRRISDLRPVITEKGDTKTYLWEIENMPELISEPMMPPWADVAPRLAVSSFSFWQEVSNWFNGLLSDQFELDEPARAKVKELVAQAADTREKARNIFHYVASKIRYVGLEYGQSGYKPHRAKEIFLNKYGDCKDQATLLVAMLRQVEIPAYLVLINTTGGGRVIKDLPMMQFNHCLAVVDIDGEKFWLDPTAGTCSFGDLPKGDQDRHVFVMYSMLGSFDKTPLYPPENNVLQRSTNLEIRLDESVHGYSTLLTRGNYNIGFRGYKYHKPIKRERILKRMLNSLYPGGELINYSFSDLDDLNAPVKITMEYAGPKFLKQAGSLRIFQLPGVGISAGSVSLSKRKYDIFFKALSRTENLITITVPPNLSVRHLPGPIEKEAVGLSYKSSYRKQENKIVFKETRTIAKARISAADYPEYKKFKEGIALESDQYIILEVKPERD
ncbi:MAG: DUF3857 domain-containing protein [bacterium]